MSEMRVTYSYNNTKMCMVINKEDMARLTAYQLQRLLFLGAESAMGMSEEE